MPKTCPGAKITSIATINYINQLLFHRPSSIIFQWVYGPQLQRMSRSALEITELLWYQFRYRHCHFQVLEGPKIAIMIVPHGINRPLSSCLFNVRAHTGLKSLTREHEGTLTQTELAIIVQIPLLGVSVLPNFGAVTADRALRSRLFRVRVRLRAQLQLSTSISTFDRKKLNKNRRLRALRPP